MKISAIFFILAMTLTSCQEHKVSEEKSENNLASKIEYADKINKKVVFESDYTMFVFAMRKGQDLKPHSAPIDAPLVMLEGSAKITIGNTETVVNKGDYIMLPKDVMHRVYTITDCKFMLIK